MRIKEILFAIVAVSLIGSVLTIQSCKKSDDTTTTPTTIPTAPAGITIPQQERSLVMDFTATWCEYCGTWGVPQFDYSARTHAANVVAIAVHFSIYEGGEATNLYCATADSLGVHFGSANYGPPWFSEGNSVVIDGAPSYSQTQYPIDSTVLDVSNYAPLITTRTGQTPVANTGMSTSISGSTITIKTSTKFFTAANGNYYLAVYLLEDGIIASQNTFVESGGVISNNEAFNTGYHEEHVLRGSPTSGGFGESIASGSVTAGAVVNKTYTMNISSSWNSSKLSVATVIWKNVSGNYEYVNSNISSNSANSN